MKRLFSYLLQYKKILFGALGLSVIGLLFSMLDPQILRILTDDYALKAGEFTKLDFLKGILLLGAGLVGVAFVSRTATTFQDYFVNVLKERVSARVYANSVQHVFKLPYFVFENQRSGSMLLNLQKVRDGIKSLIEAFISTLFLPIISITLVIAYAFYVHWAIAITFLILIPVVMISTILLSKNIKKAQRKVVQESSELSGSTTETLRNVGLIKSLGLEEQEINRLNSVNDKVVNLELKKVIYIRTLFFIQGTMVNAVRVAVYMISFYLIWEKSISYGEFFVFTFYTFYIFNPLYGLPNLISKYQEYKAVNEELDKILAIPVEKEQSGGKLIDQIQEIVFQKVSFTYEDKEESAVSNVNFSLTSGKTIAFVGPSGSGKSTVIKLLVGLYQPNQGIIRINKENREEINMDIFKRKIGYVSQDTELFSGSIRENLLFVKPDATDEEIINVLQQAKIEHILKREGSNDFDLDIKVGESGVKLSGGERQRLAIARALLRNPDLIIFDEATSALDSLTEKEIITTIFEIRKNHKNLMMVMIAHRLSTIQEADQIFLMKNSMILEQGTHNELLNSDSEYKKLWEAQLNSF